MLSLGGLLTEAVSAQAMIQAMGEPLGTAGDNPPKKCEVQVWPQPNTRQLAQAEKQGCGLDCNSKE